MDPRSRTFLIAFLLALALAKVPLAHGAWRPYGAAIATASNSQDQVSATPDGAGGMILVWRDRRTDLGDIYVQRVDGAGNEVWAPGGISICNAVNVQQLPQIVSDDQGGAIVAWQDTRSDPKGDIYAQRVNGSGTPLWFPNGVPLITGAGENDETVSRFRMIRDGSGGAIFTFSDSRNSGLVSEPGNSKVWAERVTSAGSPLWSPGGVPVAAAPGILYENASLVSDGLGGCIVAWQDGSGADWDILAQHLDAGGFATWGGGVTLCAAANKQILPEVAPDGAGGAVVAWVDSRFDANGDIYAQRVSAAGTPQWTPAGNVVVFGPSANIGGDYSIRMILDHSGGVTLVFADDRRTTGVPDPGFPKVWAQRIGLDGTPLWGNGLPVDAENGTHTRQVIVEDSKGGSIVVWQKTGAAGNQNIHAQRLDPSGAALWNTTLCNDLAAQTAPAAVADGLGSVLAVWSDARTDVADVYGNKIDFAGVPGASSQWQCSSYAPNGVPATGGANNQDQAVAAPDGEGGVFIAWRDRRTDAGDIYAQHVNSTGAVLWSADGVPICTALSLQQEPRIVSDGVGGAIIAWQDNRVDPSGDMYAQRVDAAGTTLWTPDGVAQIVGPSLNTQSTSSFRMIQDGTGGAIFTFRDNRLLGGALDTYPKVWAQRIEPATGFPLWGNGALAGGGPNVQDLGAPVSDGLGGVIVAWEDRRTGLHFDITAQRIDFAGVPRWGASGVVVCNLPNDQLVPDITSDGDGGAIIVWSDSRVDPNGDIYAQRVSYLGAPVWAANGIAQVTGPSVNNVGEHLIRMIPDGAGGALLAFADNRDFGGIPDPAAMKVWAQHVKPGGFPDWGNGVPVGADAGVHDHHQILPDGEGGAVIVWQDGTLGPGDIYAQRLKPNGAAYWTVGGVIVCDAVSAQTAPSVAPDGRGHAIAAWTDARFGATDVFTQRVCVPNAMVTGVPGDASPPSARSALSAPAPNPTGDAMSYTITLTRAKGVKVRLCDVAGRVVATLLDRTLDAGEHPFAWSRSRLPARLAGGVYFLSLVSAETREARKVVLLR